MKKILINLSDKTFASSRQRLNVSAKKFGFDEVYSYDVKDLNEFNFYKFNKEIFKQRRGLGFWLWKPYLILDTFNKANEGDLIVYADCGIDIISPLDPLFELTKKQPVIVFQNCNFLNENWTKRDCFFFSGCDSNLYYKAAQCDAAFIIFLKASKSYDFLIEWTNLCTNKFVLTDLPNICGLPNLDGFLFHRHDQSVLSLLSEKYKFELFRMPTQYGNYYKMEEFRVPGEFNCINSIYWNKQVLHYSKNPKLNSPYFQLLDHHKTKKISFLNLLLLRVKYSLNRLKNKVFSTKVFNPENYDFLSKETSKEH